jgi:hypothetical protein
MGVGTMYQLGFGVFWTGGAIIVFPQLLILLKTAKSPSLGIKLRYIY